MPMGVAGSHARKSRALEYASRLGTALSKRDYARAIGSPLTVVTTHDGLSNLMGTNLRRCAARLALVWSDAAISDRIETRKRVGAVGGNTKDG